MEQPAPIPSGERQRQAYTTMRATEALVLGKKASGTPTLDSYLEANAVFAEEAAKTTKNPRTGEVHIDNAERYRRIRIGSAEGKRRFCHEQAERAQRDADKFDKSAKETADEHKLLMAQKHRALAVGWLLFEATIT